MAAMPGERSLVENYKDRPFELIGVNTDPEGEAGSLLKRAAEMDIPMRSFLDGSTSGPITKAWGVSAFPTQILIDHEGIVQGIDLAGTALDEEIERLLVIAEAAAVVKAEAEAEAQK